MSLQIGQQLGSYEITSFIGKGGMGEVYRARDTRLKRDVAIKILPDEFSRDADRVSRFQREAESLAALNHPNIAAIYDLQQSDTTRFLILEFVEGDTLADILKTRGALLVDEALQIAKHICEALEAAHERGIIHRDLKPANVKITPDGKAKVLDFGLAKAFALETSTAALSNSPTLSMAATNAGVILGTAAYMSPEQARGRAIDRRTDIFAFGAVVYEMLTGRAAFEGEDTAEILSRVLQRDVDWAPVPDNVPPRIRELLKLCLQKDAKKRRQTAADVRIDIEQALAQPAVTTPASQPGRSSRLGWTAFAGALVVAAVLAIPAVRHLRETPLPEMRVEINTPATTEPISFALSPDGRQIVFAASGDGESRLWMRELDKVAAQPLTGTEGGKYPFWSPDSQSVGFFAGGKLKRINLAGGSPQPLAEAADRGGTWNTDGVILFAQDLIGPLFRVPAAGGQPAVAATRLEPGQARHRFPHFLPDGRQFLFWSRGTPETSGIFLGSLDSTETKRLTPADTAGSYLSSGWVLWVRAGALVAQRLDLKQKVLTGDPVTLADPVAFTAGAGDSALSISTAGLVAYRAPGAVRRQLTWFDRSGKPLGTMGEPELDGNLRSAPRFSRDGSQVTTSRTVSGNADIYILAGNRTTRFTFDAGNDRSGIWSPDGSRIVFQSGRKGNADLYHKPSSNAGVEEPLLYSGEDKIPLDWSADGRFLLYSSLGLMDWDLWVLPWDDHKPFVFRNTNAAEMSAKFSPNGRWVAYMSNETERMEIYVRPFTPPGAFGTAANPAAGQWQVSRVGGTNPRWRPDGKELYYIGPDGAMMAAAIMDKGTTLEVEAPMMLFPTRIYGGGVESIPEPEYDVTASGRFLINTVLDETSRPITLIQNWKPPAK